MTIINPIVIKKKKGKIKKKRYLKFRQCEFTEEELETMDEFDRRMIEDKKFRNYVIGQIDIALEQVNMGEYIPMEEAMIEFEKRHSIHG